ncbi:potassium:chloride symporter [Aureococcus anophagefferens]|nr:potassium:chloride symporter [Aureococcus anophagefferens]
MGGGDDAEGGALVAKAAVESHIAAVVREESTRLHPAPASPASPDAGAKKKLGTIKGVFVPTMQNILGVILFLRVPFIVGQAGILEGLAIVWLSCATTLLTSISMSAIATNGVPRGGGCYTMIKNALGAQFGGVTGTLLFLSNTFGVAMYVLGCVEVLKDCFPAVFEGVNDRLLGVAVLASLSLIVFVGVEYIARFAVVFLAGVVLSVLSIWAGVVTAAAGQDKPNQGVVGFSGAACGPTGRYTRALGISWDLCGNQIFNPTSMCAYATAGTSSRARALLPAVTDPLAGRTSAATSRTPGSIPPGTLAAVVATIAIFTVQVVLVAGGSCRRRAVDDPFIVSSIAWPSDKLVCVGVLLSTLGAGLQSLAGAPRLLAAIGRDGLIPPLARAPRRPRAAALALCACLSCCCVMLGSLDAVAPFITLWFLTCYAIINLACAYLGYERIPSFRPTYRRYDWRLSLLGVAVCGFMMFFIAPLFALGALAVAAALYKYIETQPGAGAGDVGDDGDAVEFELAPLTPGGADARDPTDSQRRARRPPRASRTGAAASASSARGTRCSRAPAYGRAARRALEAGDIQFKYWRPFVLFLCKLDPVGDVSYVPQAGMINMIAQLMRRGKGLALVNGVVPAQRIDADVVACAQRARNLRATLRERGVEGFADAVVAASASGCSSRPRASPLWPNTVAVGWPDRRREGAGFDAGGFASIVDDAHAVGKTVLVCSGAVDYPDGRDGARVLDGGTIDVWWVFDLFPAGGLLLLLPFLLKKDRVWARCKMRLIVVSPRGADEARLEAAVRAMLSAGGIADAVLLEVDAKDAPRYAPGLDAQHSCRAKAPDVRDSITKYVGDAALGAADVRVDDGDGGAPAAAPSKLTGLIAAHSGGAELVVISLPKRRANATAAAWMDSVDTMIRGLRRHPRQESGQEKVQFFQ